MKSIVRIQLISFSILFITACASQKEVQTNTVKEPEVSEFTSDTTETAPKSKEVSVKKNEPLFHIVQKGESLWVIAKKYGVSIEAIAEANNIEDTSLIKINQKLRIPEK